MKLLSQKSVAQKNVKVALFTSGLQRTDGMFGSFVVREPREHDPQKEHYDIDDFSHLFLVTDWMDRLGIDKFVNHHHTTVSYAFSFCRMLLIVVLLYVHFLD